jgi:hypothetical protein
MPTAYEESRPGRWVRRPVGVVVPRCTRRGGPSVSPWFKVTAEKVQAQHLEVALAWTKVNVKRGIACEAHRGGETVLLTGLIPFTSIIEFDEGGYGPDPYPTLFLPLRSGVRRLQPDAVVSRGRAGTNRRGENGEAPVAATPAR